MQHAALRITTKRKFTKSTWSRYRVHLHYIIIRALRQDWIQILWFFSKVKWSHFQHEFCSFQVVCSSFPPTHCQLEMKINRRKQNEIKCARVIAYRNLCGLLHAFKRKIRSDSIKYLLVFDWFSSHPCIGIGHQSFMCRKKKQPQTNITHTQTTGIERDRTYTRSL